MINSQNERVARVSNLESELIDESVQYFVNKNYFHAYSCLYKALKIFGESKKIISLLASYALATGCKELAEYYVNKIDHDDLCDFIRAQENVGLLKFVLFNEDEHQKWNNYKRKRNINELNRFGVTAPLCKGDVLEVGCANGDLSSAIAMHADRLFGIDIDPIAIELARLKICKYGLDNCYFKLGDATNLEFQDDSFDTVVLAEVLEHVSEPNLFIKEAIRVCKQQGKIIISVPKGYSIPDEDHVRIFTKETLEDLVFSCSNQKLELIEEVPLPWILGSFENKKDGNAGLGEHNLTDYFLPPHPLQPLDISEKVTIIIPTFNRSHYLPHTLNSALNQTYPNKEIIVVDDGSTDQTRDILKRYKDRITYFRKENGGKSSALNIVLPKATGKYIWILDDDDLALPKKLELQVRKFQEDKDIGLIHTSAVFMEEQDGEKIYTGMWHAREVPRLVQLKEKLKGNYYFSPTVVAKREAFEKAGLFDEQLIKAQDYDMWVRISLSYKITALPVPTIHYRTGHRDQSEIHHIAKETHKGDQIIIRKVRNIPLEHIFPKKANTDDVVYQVESLLERAAYMGYHDLLNELTEDIMKARIIAERSGTLLNFSLEGLQIISHLNKFVNHIKSEAPSALSNLNYFIEVIEKAKL